MKNLKQIMLLVMTVTTLSITSCSKNDDGGAIPLNTVGGTITAMASGQEFTTSDFASVANTVNGGGQTTLILQGSNSTVAILISVAGYEGVGTYEFTVSNVFINANYTEINSSAPAESQTWSVPYEDSGVAGQVQIAEDAGGRIKGTFSFTGKNDNDSSLKTISEGSFDLAKTEN